MKVLIVVNAVEKPSDLHAIVGDQLDWFGPGSRIIVTSQNEEILKEYDSDKAPTYMVTELDDGQAFKLFCKHAFRMQSSIPDYDGLSNCIGNATEKLPLAIEVVGSFLRGKSIQEWEMMEKSVKARLMSSQKTTVGLQELLDICNGELDHQQKDIFLDIACFISGVDARIASYLWPNCYPSSGCILMPLAKIGENNELQMHRLLRRLGKRIFEQEGSGDPIGRKFYIQEKGMENVEALLFDFTAEYFQLMPELRFLKLDNAKVSGNFGGAFASLRWLCWQRCPLDLIQCNEIEELPKLPPSLICLRVSSKRMKAIPLLEDLKELDELCLSDGDLKACRPPSKKLMPESNVQQMIGKPSFSISFPKLTKLELSLSQIIKLKFEPKEITQLKMLVLSGSSLEEVSELPKTLSVLSIQGCSSLKRLPTVQGLNNLSVFKLYHSAIEEIEGLECLKALKRLDISNCKIQNLHGVGRLTSLRSLILSDCDYLDSLPDLSNLKLLKLLEIRQCKMIHQIEGLEELTSLEKLNISGCLAENSVQVQNVLRHVMARSTDT
ncbi:hypothetical protein ACJRO7_015366 [Eucalyptus globulus]|uniref:NB-ARC domain-containing protein n=1 Tax=Eucalyptus globulus TaxID=34317 RepID=A0ABD3L3Y6_EUCGL